MRSVGMKIGMEERLSCIVFCGCFVQLRRGQKQKAQALLRSLAKRICIIRRKERGNKKIIEKRAENNRRGSQEVGKGHTSTYGRQVLLHRASRKHLAGDMTTESAGLYNSCSAAQRGRKYRRECT